MKRTDNTLDKLLRYLPGYTGYEQREERRQSDAQVRARVCAAMEQCEEIARERLDTELARGDNAKIEAAESCRKRINTLAAQVRFAATGNSGFMAREVMGEREIEALTERDLKLLQMTTQLLERVDDLSWFDLTHVIQQLEQLLHDREQFLREFK